MRRARIGRTLSAMGDHETNPAHHRDGEDAGLGASLCSPFLNGLLVTGASMTVLATSNHQLTIHSTDRVAARLEELQFELGEGPHWQALRSGRPALIPEVHAADWSEWPMFGAALGGLGAGAIFAFPMAIGAATVGVINLYRTDSGGLTSRALATARALAWSAAEPALRAAALSADSEAQYGVIEAPEMRREVHQATGVVLVQLGISPTDAFLRLRGHAFSTGCSVEDVARDVVEHRVDFRLLAG